MTPPHRTIGAPPKKGVLNIKRCTSCHELHWYPQALCPSARARLNGSAFLPGAGTIYSVSVTRCAGSIPYAITYVTLDEGVIMLTNIVDCDFDSLRIGQRVKVCLKPAEGGAMVPMFTPA